LFADIEMIGQVKIKLKLIKIILRVVKGGIRLLKVALVVSHTTNIKLKLLSDKLNFRIYFSSAMCAITFT
jgi:hypothetical protein